VNIAGSGRIGGTSPVAQANIISGLVRPTSSPKRSSRITLIAYRAMLVESGNPAHSLADSQRMREALSSLDLLVVIDVRAHRDRPPG